MCKRVESPFLKLPYFVLIMTSLVFSLFSLVIYAWLCWPFICESLAHLSATCSSDSVGALQPRSDVNIIYANVCNFVYILCVVSLFMYVTHLTLPIFNHKSLSHSPTRVTVSVGVSVSVSSTRRRQTHLHISNSKVVISIILQL